MKNRWMAMLFVLLLTVTVSSCGGNISPGDGEKIGQIIKVSKQGMISKTWEAQLIRGGMVGGSGSFGVVPFDFTIESELVAQKVIEYMQNQTEVLIKYRMEGVYSVFRTDSQGYFLISIEPAKK